MFYYKATNKLVVGDKIKIYNYGNCERDFTYIDDIIEGLFRVIQGAPVKCNGKDGLPISPYAIYNIGGGSPVNLMEFIEVLQNELQSSGVLPADYDFSAHQEMVGMQPGDVRVTYADCSSLENDFDFKPQIDIRIGLKKFVNWYKNYYFE